MKEALEKIEAGVYEFEMMVNGMLVIAESKTPSDEKAELMFLVQALRLMQEDLSRHYDAAGIPGRPWRSNSRRAAPHL